MPPPGARALAYIALYEAPQPSDQTDLNERLLFVLKGNGGRIHELTSDWLYRWDACPHPWATAQLLSRIHLPFGPEPSRTFQITEKLCVALLSLCKPDMWAFLGSFQQTPYRNRHSPKLMEFCQ
jgi:hypothetical protein